MFSAVAADHIQRPRRRGALAEATHFGASGVPGEGPFVQIWLRIKDTVIRDAAYETHGCPSSVACASMLCELAIGRELIRLQTLTAPELIRILGGLPEGKEIHASNAIAALAAMAPKTTLVQAGTIESGIERPTGNEGDRLAQVN